MMICEHGYCWHLRVNVMTCSYTLPAMMLSVLGISIGCFTNGAGLVV